LFVSHYQPSATPSARIILVGYTNVTVTNSDILTHGKWLRAQMAVTNEGNSSFTYRSWGSEPYGSVRAETVMGWTNGHMAPPFTGLFTVVRPHGASAFSVWLPPNTLRWQCGIPLQTSSMRERAIWKVLQLPKRIPGFQLQVYAWSFRLLPDKDGKEMPLDSILFEVNTSSNASPNDR
jgi:hypothetical protein